LTIEAAELERATLSWSQLSAFGILRTEKIQNYRLTPYNLSIYQGHELDISSLGVISRNLPNLEGLILSLLACDTSILEPDQCIPSFRRLKTLKLGLSSLWNWKRHGFDQHEAARYISAILPSGCQFSIEPISPPHGSDEDSEWQDFTRECNQFLTSFRQRVVDYMKIRKGEVNRITSGSYDPEALFDNNTVLMDDESIILT
jgi:hypothetical protein